MNRILLNARFKGNIMASTVSSSYYSQSFLPSDKVNKSMQVNSCGDMNGNTDNNMLYYVTYYQKYSFLMRNMRCLNGQNSRFLSSFRTPFLNKRIVRDDEVNISRNSNINKSNGSDRIKLQSLLCYFK